MAGWIKMSIGMEVGLGLGDFVLHRNPALPCQKGGGAEPPIFGPCLLWTNCCMDQDGTWHGGGARSRPHCARWNTAPLPKKGGEPPVFGPFLLWPNCCMHQDATWYGGRSRPRRLFVRWGPSSPPQERGGAPLHNFRPMSIVARRLDGSRWHLTWR